jgi:hypothetical protein
VPQIQKKVRDFFLRTSHSLLGRQWQRQGHERRGSEQPASVARGETFTRRDGNHRMVS